MRAFLAAVTIAVAAAPAFAEIPRGLVSGGEQIELLDGHLKLKLFEGMVREGDRAHLDWGASRFTIEAFEIVGVSAGTLHARVAERLGAMACGRRERIVRTSTWAIFGLGPRVPPRVGDRELVFTAYAVNVHGMVEMVTFYIDQAGFDEAGAWQEVARVIASSMVPSPGPAHPVSPPAPHDLGPPRPRSIASVAATYRLDVRPRQYCDVWEDELDARAIAKPSRARMMTGKLRDRDVYWSVWTDRQGSHTETMTGSPRWGTLHVVCHATRESQLDELRRLAEQHFEIGPATPWPTRRD